MTELETDRLLLRPYSRGDLDFFASLWADPEVVRFIGEGVTRNRNEAEESNGRVYASGENTLMRCCQTPGVFRQER
ncbi:MAG: GNAT family N-acetyltransferase [Bacilli bacterium]